MNARPTPRPAATPPITMLRKLSSVNPEASSGWKMPRKTLNTDRQAVQFTVFSSKWEEIATAINNEAHRGCTVLTGMGWYSKKEVKVSSGWKMPRKTLIMVHPKMVPSTNCLPSYLFETAGRQKKLTEAGLWFATAPEEELRDIMAADPAIYILQQFSGGSQKKR